MFFVFLFRVFREKFCSLKINHPIQSRSEISLPVGKFSAFKFKNVFSFSTTANFPTTILALKIEVVDLANQFWMILMFKHKFISKTIAF